MVIAIAVVLVVFAMALPLLVRDAALPRPEPVSPTRHFEEKKATIYENLRDLQGEYRMGKLSDEDYQQTKVELQTELAAVLAEIDAVLTNASPEPSKLPPGSSPASAS
jgi:cytochrome c-type biogenesis protein CcmI